MNRMKIIKNPLMVYIHIPFCVKKCGYCDFLSFDNISEEAGYREAYINSLCSEIKAFKNRAAGRCVTSVFIGGGTPSSLDGRYIDKIIDALGAAFDISLSAEVSIECNPGTVSREKLELYRKCGVNRISFGLQSTDNEELRILGRIHTYEDFLESYRLARKAGFENINIDLMSAIPGQTLYKWSQNIKRAAGLKPEHISAYSLIIEEGTPFYDMYAGTGTEGFEGQRHLTHESTDSADGYAAEGISPGKGTGQAIRPLPDEDTERRMYYLTREILGDYGFVRYEISNYSRKGYECRHNCGYWQGTDYAGFGLGAASLFNGSRYSDTKDIVKYISGEWIEKESVHCLSQDEKIEEFMFLGLRMDKGVAVSEFKERFARNLEDVYGSKLKWLTADGFMFFDNGRWRLTDLGVDVSNRVLAEFLL